MKEYNYNQKKKNPKIGICSICVESFSKKELVEIRLLSFKGRKETYRTNACIKCAKNHKQ